MENENIVEVDVGFGRTGFVVVGDSECSICESKSLCISLDVQYETEKYIDKHTTHLCKKCIDIAFNNYYKWKRQSIQNG